MSEPCLFDLILYVPVNNFSVNLNHDMFVHICMLSQVYELLITELHIIGISFINVLSYYRCIRYLVFPALFPSISMVFIDCTCITSVTEYSKSIRLLLK